ncbi:hypothetical protein Tco_0334833, partial [Tanacetum coccineum]
HCNEFSKEEMLRWTEMENVEEGTSVDVVVDSESEKEDNGMLQDTDSDDSHYSNKSIEYLSAGED